MDLSTYYGEIVAEEGRAGGEHTDPQVQIIPWLYAYSRGEFGAGSGAVAARNSDKFVARNSDAAHGLIVNVEATVSVPPS